MRLERKRIHRGGSTVCLVSVAEVPVVVHGGEGTDSTLMVTALAQLLLDSDARTIRGYATLSHMTADCCVFQF
jgi:hypothetical protein